MKPIQIILDIMTYISTVSEDLDDLIKKTPISCIPVLNQNQKTELEEFIKRKPKSIDIFNKIGLKLQYNDRLFDEIPKKLLESQFSTQIQILIYFLQCITFAYDSNHHKTSNELSKILENTKKISEIINNYHNIIEYCFKHTIKSCINDTNFKFTEENCLNLIEIFGNSEFLTKKITKTFERFIIVAENTSEITKNELFSLYDYLSTKKRCYFMNSKLDIIINTILRSIDSTKLQNYQDLIELISYLIFSFSYNRKTSFIYNILRYIEKYQGLHDKLIIFLEIFSKLDQKLLENINEKDKIAMKMINYMNENILESSYYYFIVSKISNFRNLFFTLESVEKLNELKIVDDVIPLLLLKTNDFPDFLVPFSVLKMNSDEIITDLKEIKEIDLILSNENNNKYENTEKIMNFIANLQNFPKLMKILKFLAIGRFTRQLTYILLQFDTVFVINPDLPVDFVKILLNSMFELYFSLPIESAPYVISIITKIAEVFRSGLVNSLKKSFDLLKIPEKRDISMLFAASFTVDIITNPGFSTEVADSLQLNLFNIISEILNENHLSNNFLINLTILINSIFEKMDEYLEIMMDIAEKIVKKEIVFEYMLSNELLSRWAMVNIWDMLKKYQNCENQFYRFKAISALTELQTEELYSDSIKRVFDGLVYDLTLKEFENSEELQFEMNITPNPDTLSVRGSLMKLIKQNEGDSEYNENNSLKINGIKLIYTDDESHSFALYIFAYLDFEIDDSQKEFLMSKINPTSLVVLSMIDMELAAGIALCQKTDDLLLNYAIDFVKRSNIVENSHDIQELFKEFERKIPKDEIIIITDEFDEILLKIISEIQENPDLDKEMLQKIMEISCYYMLKYVDLSFCSNLLQIYLNSAKKMEIVPEQLITILFNTIFEIINEKSLLEEKVYYGLCEICLDQKRFDIDSIIFQFISAIMAIIKCGYTYSYAPFILIASILKICPDLSDIITNLVSEQLPQVEDDDIGMLSCWSIAFSAAIIACKGDFVFEPKKALDKWISTIHVLKSNFVVKFASKALSVLAKEKNENTYLETLEKIAQITTKSDENYSDYDNYQYIINEILK